MRGGLAADAGHPTRLVGSLPARGPIDTCWNLQINSARRARPVIDRPALIAWRSQAPWPNTVQIEQDLLLSRLMIEIARDDVLGPELAMRGGTCMHKLHLPSAAALLRGSRLRPLHPYRYQALHPGARQDRRRSRTDRLQPPALWTDGARLSRRSSRPKESAVSASRSRSTSPRPTRSCRGRRSITWYRRPGGAVKLTSQLISPSELLATKLRALYQRSKGRDLFDLWLGLTVLKPTPNRSSPASTTT